ncbi:GumC family protein [Dinghuibacter silviterrae]|uniref:non-specific protein-tyrosine kinase n=1 Tax=Dinghuibacter silviterrae TaxID=1539049 RepID=A0A4R8DTX0_9BACT|nr:tyrosine-protein kinase family protein [Dinghuibacter silviterrae]TDX01780.1 capsular exopolysaccharide synthesis family protein [Dinghuibacter silviterrae]
MRTFRRPNRQDEDENVFVQILFKYLPYWPLFVASIVVCGIVAKIYLRYATPIYEVKASFLVKDEKKGVDDQNLMEQLDLFGSKKFVENEIEVIQSRVLMREVVRNLSLYAPVTYEGKIKSVSGYIFSPVIIQVPNPDSLVERKKEYFSYDSADKKVILHGKRYPLNEWVYDSIGVLRFIPNPNYVAPVEKKPLFFSLISVKSTAEGVLHNLTASQATKLSSVIDLTYKDPVPTRGEIILNNLIDVYQKAAIYDKNALAANTLKFINERLGLVTGELDSVERGIERYKARTGIVDLSAQGEAYLESVGDNDQKLSQVNVQLAVMDQIEQYIKSKSNEPGLVPSTFGVDDPVLAALLQQLYALEAQYAGLRKTTAENNPMLLTLQSQIDRMKPNILENIQNQRTNLLSAKTALEGTSSKYASILQGLPAKERGLLSISRTQTIENGIYSFLLQKREETALSYNSAVSDTRIIDDAEASGAPVSPKSMIIYAFALIVGLGLGVVYVAIREVFNQNIIFRKEIESMTTVPVVAEVIYDGSHQHFAAADGGRSVVAEQFRQLRTTLTYLGINSKKKRILVTSSISGEGKSYVSSNLAHALAMSDKKVVLLELDLRRPAVSKAFGISREVGITNYLIGQKEGDEIIKSTSVHKNLFLIPSGPIPPNPSELISGERVAALLDYLDTIFDYIIIDSPPINPVTDSYLIAPLCHANLYVVRHAVTPKSSIKVLDANIRLHGLKNMGIIFNGIKSRGLGRYGYAYGYGYSYNYGYGENGQGKKKKRKKVNNVN